MNIHEVLNHYDDMFSHYSLEEIENFLYNQIIEAIKENDDSSLITLLNEMIGLCRDTSQKDKALTYAFKLKKLLETFHFQNSEAYATSLLNIANAYRAFSLYDEAMTIFKEIEVSYHNYLDDYDLLYASLYNNWGLLYQEINDYHQSIDLLKKALNIIILYDEPIKEAITKTNIASSYIALNNDRGFDYAKDALNIFEKEDIKDFHYNGALNAMGDYYRYKKDYHQAVYYYQKALVHLLRHTYKTDSYKRVLEKYDDVLKYIKNDFVSNLQRCKEFYNDQIAPMIETLFNEYKDRIAIGLIGEGSDCFGFDDEISQDHDYDLGVCLFVTRKDYDLFGSKLNEAYHKVACYNDSRLEKRRGVFIIEDYFIETDDEIIISQYVNGEIYKDDLGIVTKIRCDYHELLLRYKKKKLAKLLHDFSQYGQVNYARMMARRDYTSASICLIKAIECALDLVYLLNNQYDPYYKWKRKGIEKLNLKEIGWIIDELIMLPIQKEAWNEYHYDAKKINTYDECVIYIELMAKILVEELNQQGYINGNDLFLESYVERLL